ncbi:MAG: Hpt domain-containing protein [Planctomycetes bacterium]|nr:Hpt domain-containing protein [Planctomycetota bacterium]
MTVGESKTRRSFEPEELLSRCVGNLDFAQHLLNLFTARFVNDLDQLEQHLQLGDADGLMRVAHTMKGASANIAAPGLQEQAGRIEELARDHRLDQISTRLALLRDEWARFSEALAATGLPCEET